MKTFTFACGPVLATVDAPTLEQAKTKLRGLVSWAGLDEMHLADDQGVSVSLGIAPVHLNEDRHWSC